MPFPILGPSSPLIMAAHPDKIHAYRTALYLSGKTDTRAYWFIGKNKIKTVFLSYGNYPNSAIFYFHQYSISYYLLWLCAC